MSKTELAGKAEIGSTSATEAGRVKCGGPGPANGGVSDVDASSHNDSGHNHDGDGRENNPKVVDVNSAAAASTTNEWGGWKWAAPNQRGKPITTVAEWKFFLAGAEAVNKRKALCTIGTCGTKALLDSAKAPSLRRHLKDHHPEHAEYFQQQHKKGGASTKEDDDDDGRKGSGLVGGTLKHAGAADQATAEHRRLVLGFIVGGLQPLSVVDEPCFKLMLSGLARNNDLAIPGRGSMSALVGEKATAARERLKQMLAGQAVSLTCDGWTSDHCDEVPMMRVTAHWIDEKWDSQSACLSVFELPRAYTGKM